MFYLGNGERKGGVFQPSSNFAQYELPRLSPSKVSEVVVIVTHRKKQGKNNVSWNYKNEHILTGMQENHVEMVRHWLIWGTESVIGSLNTAVMMCLVTQRINHNGRISQFALLGLLVLCSKELCLNEMNVSWLKQKVGHFYYHCCLYWIYWPIFFFPDNTSTAIGPVVGGVIGALAAIVIILFIAILLVLRHKYPVKLLLNSRTRNEGFVSTVAYGQLMAESDEDSEWNPELLRMRCVGGVWHDVDSKYRKFQVGWQSKFESSSTHAHYCPSNLNFCPSIWNFCMRCMTFVRTKLLK